MSNENYEELKSMEKRERATWDGHYISDPAVFKAVTFANQMISEGKPIKDAIGISSNYNKIPFSAVALELMVDAFIKNTE